MPHKGLTGQETPDASNEEQLNEQYGQQEYMYNMGVSYLANIFKSWITETATPRNINQIIKGHSRGAVAAGEGTMMIKAWLHDHPVYSNYENFVKFELIQYDPVPGPDAIENHKEVDYAENATMEDRGKKMMGLGNNAQTTVFYSMHTQYMAGFTPQAVQNANRVILTPFNHGIDLEKVDLTQQDGAHRWGYTDAKTGDVYRSSGINELEQGIYISTEDHKLVKIDRFEDAEKLINKYNEGNWFQQERRDLLINIIKKWFDAHAAH